MTRLITPIFGLDAAGEIPEAAAHAVRAKFVVRYLSRYIPKAITRAEADRLKAAGIHIVLVFEDNADRALLGYVAGHEDAQWCDRQSADAGLAGARFYSAFDTDPIGHPADATDGYYDGMAAVVSKHRCGPYGAYSLIGRQHDRGFEMLWQTLGWSHGQIHNAALIYQYGFNHIIGGTDVDFNHAWYPDYGQYGYRLSPVDIHSYDKFDKTIRKLNNGRRAAEFPTVIEYDKYREEQTWHRHPHRGQLAVLRSDCLELARRIASVAKEPHSGGYGPNNREWRYKQLVARYKGELVKS